MTGIKKDLVSRDFQRLRKETKKLLKVKANKLSFDILKANKKNDLQIINAIIVDTWVSSENPKEIYFNGLNFTVLPINYFSCRKP